MEANAIPGYQRNIQKSMAAYNVCFQHMVESAFSELSHRYELPNPLCYSHNFILQCLYYASEPMTLAQISRESGQALPNVSIAANSLQENGLIAREKDEQDHRKYLVTLTEKGKKLCDEYITEYLSDIVDKLYNGLSEEDFHRFFDTLDHIETNVRRIMPKRQNGQPY